MSSASPSAESPTTGTVAPDFALIDQYGTTVRLADVLARADLRGVFVYFYPKALTSGCTTQATTLRDAADQLSGVAVIGISPDPVDRLRAFDDKHQLGFTLLSDEQHDVAEKYGVWTLKKLYGREYMGVQRSAFLIGPDGTIERAWPKISPKDTVPKLVAALED